MGLIAVVCPANNLSFFFLQHKLEASLLALGQFQHALAEVMSWLNHTAEMLDAQKPISGDPKVIEVELAKHHVSIGVVCNIFVPL